jgi:hypothetical protein
MFFKILLTFAIIKSEDIVNAIDFFLILFFDRTFEISHVQSCANCTSKLYFFTLKRAILL